EPEEFNASMEGGLHLSFDHAVVHPHDTRPDTPGGHWAFPYKDNSLVTLPRGDLTFLVDIPSRGRFLTSVRMPLEGAYPAWATVRINGQQLFSKLLLQQEEVNLDLSRFGGQRIELQLAATPTPQGDHASWVQWVAPRIIAEP